MKSILVLILLLQSALVFGGEVTTTEGIKIKANETNVDLAKGVVIYKGSVFVTKKSLSFRADLIKEYRKNSKLIKIVASGEPMIYIDTLAVNKGVAKGEAKKLIYNAETGKVVLSNYSLISASGDTSSGMQATYILAK